MTKRIILLALAATATASCRQIAGIQDLPKPCGDPLMIDDMEDGDWQICHTDGRQGAWFGFGDGSNGTETLDANATIPGGRSASRRAVHFSGGGFTNWGAIVGFNFNDDGLGRNTYDAGGAGGLTFWMKSDIALDVELMIPETVTTGNSGTCVEAEGNCNNNFRFSITSPGDGWKQYKVPFTALRQTGSATWNPAKLLGAQFVVRDSATFDIWIDDVAFYYCADTECLPTCTDPMRSVACATNGRRPAGCFPTGVTCATVDSWCADPLLVDDMEDLDEYACDTGSRKGRWWDLYDGSNPPAQLGLDQIPGGRGSSHGAAHLVGSGLGVGAAMAVVINNPGSQTYDASGVDGVRFWMKGAGTGILMLPTAATTAPGDTMVPGGTCSNG